MVLSALRSSTAPAGESARRAVTWTGGRVFSFEALGFCSGTNLAVPRLFSDGKICLVPSQDTHLAVDVVGWYS